MPRIVDCPLTIVELQVIRSNLAMDRALDLSWCKAVPPRSSQPAENGIFGRMSAFRQELQQRLGCGADIAVAAVNSGDWDGGAHRWNIQRHQRAPAEFIAHTALGHQRQAEASLGQALLGGQTVDQSDVSAVEPGTNQLARERMTGVSFAWRRRKA